MRKLLQGGFLFLSTLVFLTPAAAQGESTISPPSPTRWSIEGGYGIRLWDSQNGGTSEQQSYQEKAKQGWVAGGDVSVFPWNSLGLGVSYFRFMKTVTADEIGFFDGTRGKSRDVYLIEFVGPAAYWRHRFASPGSRAWEAVIQAGGGVIYYDNQHDAPDFPGVLQSVVPGFYTAVSLDRRLTRWFGLGVSARVLYGSLDNLSYNGIDVDVPAVSLTRVDLAAGIRFYP